MNRYTSGGASKASRDTLCQKCLKRGHYSYECTASQQDRPYVSRPSRTQQLLNPKLAPKIVEATTKTSESKQGNSARTDEPKQKGSIDQKKVGRPGRSPSVSTSSSDSVSTISTNLSRSSSRSSHRSQRNRSNREEEREPRRNDAHRRQQRSGLHGRSGERRSTSSERPPYRKRSRDERSPRVRSRSPSDYRRRRRDSNGGSNAQRGLNVRASKKSRSRSRSLSPYSKRLALSRSRE